MTKKRSEAVAGFCLAAGLATRLRPLTDHIPKARVPIAGVASLHYALMRLERCGISRTAVNSHHLHEQVAQLLKEYPGKMALEHSYEPELLGSGGAYHPLRSWFSDAHILTSNPDVLCDLDINAYIDEHLRSKNVVTIAVFEHAPDGKKGTVWFDDKHHLRHVGKTEQSGCHAGYGLGFFLLSPEIYQYLDAPGFSSLIDAINAAIKAGANCKAFVHHGYLKDLGDSLSDILAIHTELIANDAKLYKSLDMEASAKACGVKLKLLRHEEKISGICTDSVRIDPRAQIGQHCFLSGALHVAEHAILNNVVIDDSDTIMQKLSNHLRIEGTSIKL